MRYSIYLDIDVPPGTRPEDIIKIVEDAFKRAGKPIHVGKPMEVIKKAPITRPLF